MPLGPAATAPRAHPHAVPARAPGLLARLPRRAALAAAAIVAAAITPASAPARSPSPQAVDVWAADALAGAPGTEGRERAVKRWAEHAGLAELMYLLRRPAADLRELEPMLVSAALKLAPDSREALRRRLSARLVLADPRKARLRREELATLISDPPFGPRSSVFEVAALLPDSGGYESYSRSLLQGIRAGLGPSHPDGSLPIGLQAFSTGERSPQVVAAFDSAALVAGSFVGELLSPPTLVLATAARMGGVPLISPTATDESIGAMGRTIFQIGPSGFERGETLARSVLDGRPRRVGVLVSAAVEPSAFARGFARAAEDLDATVVWSASYPAGAVNFREEVGFLMARQVEILFWDGDAREAESLLRQLSRERVSLRICGGEALGPEQHHEETRRMLEGVQYVSDDWELSEAARSRLDSLMVVDTGLPATPLHVRGWLAGRLLRAAVASGALCPEELVRELRARTEQDPSLRARGFLDVRREGAHLEVYTVVHGRGVTAP